VGTVQTLNRSMTLRESSSKHWDEADFRVVFLQHYARIVAILVRLLGDRSPAEEVANDAFGACTTSLRCRSTATSAVGCTVRRLTSVSMLCVQVAAAANMRELPDGSWKNAQSPSTGRLATRREVPAGTLRFGLD
jgi:hypothetical protein